ncbi:hypothetical protein AB7M74_011260 [Bradyrhizobium japonicum]
MRNDQVMVGIDGDLDIVFHADFRRAPAAGFFAGNSLAAARFAQHEEGSMSKNTQERRIELGRTASEG